MKTYWKLSTLEKSELSQEELEHYIQIELMQQGVSIIPILQLQEVPEAPVIEIDKTVFEIKQNYSSVCYLEKEEDFKTFLNCKPISISSSYHDGDHYSYQEEEKGNKFSLAPVVIYKRSSISNNSEFMKKRNLIIQQNVKLTEENKEAMDKKEKALENLYDNLSEVRTLIRRCRTFLNTWESYKELAENETGAYPFFLAFFKENSKGMELSILDIFSLLELETPEPFLTPE